MNRYTAKSLAAAAVLLCLALPAWADRHGRHDFGHRDYPHRDGGHWRHEWHDGRFGWWWVIGTAWYLYPQPVYPYAYGPPVVVQDPPQVVVVPQSPAVSAPPPAAPAQYWYYCTPSKTYYPYVQACPGGWTQVPVTPPGAPQ